jgi:dGTPase
VLARFPNEPIERLRGELIRHQIGVMVNDVIATTSANLAVHQPQSVEDVRRAGRRLADFSPALEVAEKEHKAFMYRALYHHPSQLAVAEVARGVVVRLFAAYHDDPRLLPFEWRDTLPDAEPDRARHIGDFIAGMTDRYALNRHSELIGPVSLPDAA